MSENSYPMSNVFRHENKKIVLHVPYCIYIIGQATFLYLLVDHMRKEKKRTSIEKKEGEKKKNPNKKSFIWQSLHTSALRLQFFYYSSWSLPQLKVHIFFSSSFSDYMHFKFLTFKY